MSDKGIEFKMPRTFDKYTMQARVMPALIVLLPLVLAAVAWDPKVENTIHVLGGIFLAMGALALLAHLARAAGKQAEQTLLSQWGGWPSTIMLRHSDDNLNPIDKQRYHEALGKLVPGAKIPTSADEEMQPAAADHVYEACCTWLKSQTVDEHRFHRLFAENMGYGFRRNFYGLRKWATGSVIAGSLACLAKVAVSVHHSDLALTAVICFVLCLALGLVFRTLLTPATVRAAGDDYARRLLAAIDELPDAKPKTKARRTKSTEEAE